MPSIPKFSAVIMNYNDSEFFPNSLEVMLNQTVAFDEIIIIDDCSTDNSVEIIRDLIKDHPEARLIQNQQNMGVIYNLNAGLKEATGDFIFYVASDDSYSNKIVEYGKKALEKFPDVAMISGNTRICNTDTNEERIFKLPFPQEIASYTPEDLEKTACKRTITFYGGANIIRKDAFIKEGGYLAKLEWHCDWFLYLAVAHSNKFVVIPEEFSRVRISNDQYSKASFDWKQQKPVIKAFIETILNDYPQHISLFKDNALLPTYDLQALPMILKDKNLRAYLTPLLFWRLLTYKPLRAIARVCIPNNIRGGLRKLLKV